MGTGSLASDAPARPKRGRAAAAGETAPEAPPSPEDEVEELGVRPPPEDEAAELDARFGAMAASPEARVVAQRPTLVTDRGRGGRTAPQAALLAVRGSVSARRPYVRMYSSGL